MKTTIIGYPRIGANRELKKYTESYFKKEITQAELLDQAQQLRKQQWTVQNQAGIDFIPVNDFSFYDNMLDLAFALNAIPKRYRDLQLNDLDTYFAMARGYQENNKDVKALRMKKWFNTNYHYLVPEIDNSTEFAFNGNKLFSECQEAEQLAINYKPVLIGPFTFIKLSKNLGNKSNLELANQLIAVYQQIFAGLAQYKFEYLQLDEPALVLDNSAEDLRLFEHLYQNLLKEKNNFKIVLQTYFGDIRDGYKQVIALNFDAIGLDFIEGHNLELIQQNGFPADKVLFAGVVNGKNIWRNNFQNSLELLKQIKAPQIVLGSSCSLLHVPYCVDYETQMADKYKRQLCFAQEKLTELVQLSQLAKNPDFAQDPLYLENQQIIAAKKSMPESYQSFVREKTATLQDSDFSRLPAFQERIRLQQDQLQLPLLPTTTIGSFPQTAEVRAWRRDYKNQKLSEADYQKNLKNKIAEIIKMQEEIGLDVLVHGEYERNDMVEYFGENLQGFLFTQNGWVQSYGTRGVKPPIIFGDIFRQKDITVEWSSYAQSLTSKPVKGMLTGPVTILNWSFPREDLGLQEIAFQIGLAIREEVLALEKAGIKVIQIDEAALREKLPLRKCDWEKDYLSWAIKSFRLVHSGVQPQTQIHTHMCYSEFSDIINEIKQMDADVITIESARSDLYLLDVLKEVNYDKQIGPGVYDIHSPRVPSIEEMRAIITKMKEKLPVEQLWVNPDCGLKTRGEQEVKLSLINMVQAAQQSRA